MDKKKLIMINQPLVSILMNCFNGEKYLREAIDSIINQTYQNWELVFWDNQSTDKSKAIFDSYRDNRLKYHYATEHTDLGGGRANAYKHLVGDYIAILDVDDLWLPTKLEKQLKLFSDPDIGIAISDTLFFNEVEERALYGREFPLEGHVFREMLVNYSISLETVMLRKSVLDRLEYGFDSDFSFIADFDLILRVLFISKLGISKEILAKWRVHEESDSWKSSVSFSEEREVWIEKQARKNPCFLTEYKKEVSILHSKNFLLMAINSLSKNERVDALRLISKTNFTNWHDYALVCLCFMPFSNTLLHYLQKRRVKNLML